MDFFGFYPFGLHLRRHKYGRRVGGGTFAGERQAHIHRTAGYGMGGRKTKREKFISALPPLLQTQKSCFWREVVGCNIRASNRQDPASVQLSLSLSLYLPSVRKRAKGGGSDKRGDEFCFRPARIRIIFGVSLTSVFAPSFPLHSPVPPKTTQLDRRRIRLHPSQILHSSFGKFLLIPISDSGRPGGTCLPRGLTACALC